MLDAVEALPLHPSLSFTEEPSSARGTGQESSLTAEASKPTPSSWDEDLSGPGCPPSLEKQGPGPQSPTHSQPRYWENQGKEKMLRKADPWGLGIYLGRAKGEIDSFEVSPNSRDLTPRGHRH